MAGKVCLATAATSGAGRVTATALAAQRAEVKGLLNDYEFYPRGFGCDSVELTL